MVPFGGSAANNGIAVRGLQMVGRNADAGVVAGRSTWVVGGSSAESRRRKLPPPTDCW